MPARRQATGLLLRALWLLTTAGAGLSLLPGLSAAAALMVVGSLGFMLLLIWRLARAAPGDRLTCRPSSLTWAP